MIIVAQNCDFKQKPLSLNLTISLVHMLFILHIISWKKLRLFLESLHFLGDSKPLSGSVYMAMLCRKSWSYILAGRK